MAAFEAWLVFLILVVNVVGELQRKRTLAASRGFLAAAWLSCWLWHASDDKPNKFTNNLPPKLTASEKARSVCDSRCSCSLSCDVVIAASNAFYGLNVV